MHEMDQKITHDTNLGIIIWAWEYLVYSVYLVLITRLSLLLLLLYPWKTQNLETHSSSLIRIRGIRSPNSNNEFKSFLWNFFFSTCHQPCLWIISYITYLHWFWEVTRYYYYYYLESPDSSPQKITFEVLWWCNQANLKSHQSYKVKLVAYHPTSATTHLSSSLNFGSWKFHQRQNWNAQQLAIPQSSSLLITLFDYGKLWKQNTRTQIKERKILLMDQGASKQFKQPTWFVLPKYFNKWKIFHMNLPWVLRI